MIVMLSLFICRVRFDSSSGCAGSPLSPALNIVDRAHIGQPEWPGAAHSGISVTDRQSIGTASERLHAGYLTTHAALVVSSELIEPPLIVARVRFETMV